MVGIHLLLLKPYEFLFLDPKSNHKSFVRDASYEVFQKNVKKDHGPNHATMQHIKLEFFHIHLK